MVPYRQPRIVVSASRVGVDGCDPTHGIRDPVLAARRAARSALRWTNGPGRGRPGARLIRCAADSVRARLV